MFVDRHEQFNMIKNYIYFWKKIEKLKVWIFEFNKDDTMKLKVYFLNCIIESKKQWSIIMIINNKYIFFANDSMQKVWT